MKIRSMRLFILFGFLLGLSTACQTTRVITIAAKPEDAWIKVDAKDRVHGPVTESFQFTGSSDIHRVLVSRLGYKDQFIPVNRDYKKPELIVKLEPQSKPINLTVTPAAKLYSDGKPLRDELTTGWSGELQFTVDAKNNWTTHTITAERENHQTSTLVVSYLDPNATYQIRLEPMRKDLNVTTNPPGAAIYFDGELVGTGPASLKQLAFPVDNNNEFLQHELKATKAGYADDVTLQIGWDAGKTDYQIDLAAKTKKVRIITEPPGATVKIDDVEVARDASGVATTKLQFPPINDKAELKTYRVSVSKKTAEAEWVPQTMTLAWDGGKSEYTIKLKEVLTSPVDLLTWTIERGPEDWQVVPKWIKTLGMKDVGEGEKRQPATQVTKLPKGTSIDTLEISPDGSQLILTTLQGKDRSDFRSQMQVVKTDGTGGSSLLSDGKTLDLTPSFSPSGEQIVFTSDRFGKHMSICSMSAVGTPGVTNLTNGNTNDLWPQIDADPKPRLFYQALVSTREGPRLYSTLLGTTFPTDLTQEGGSQPRISPRNDAVLFTAVNELTELRDVYKVSDKGGATQNLTGTKDYDEGDPAWSRDGRKVAFTSNRGTDKEVGSNYDIWVLDLVKGGEPMQITVNGSVDDRPVWDPTGNAIFFRSNRGGEWQVWKINLK